MLFEDLNAMKCTKPETAALNEMDEVEIFQFSERVRKRQ